MGAEVGMDHPKCEPSYKSSGLGHKTNPSAVIQPIRVAQE